MVVYNKMIHTDEMLYLYLKQIPITTKNNPSYNRNCI